MSEEKDLRGLYELYALGLLDEPERSEVEQTLDTEQGRGRLREAMENNAVLMSQVSMAEPPARLRTRVLASVGAPRRSYAGILGWVTAFAALAIAVYLGVQHNNAVTALAEARGQVQQLMAGSVTTNTELARLRNVLSFLNAPETRVVSFGPNEPKPRGRVLANPSRGVLLLASNLPPAPEGRIYEMWIIPKGAQPAPAGLFQSDPSGSAIHLHEVQIAPGSLVAVTLEPESGSAAPTTTPLFAAQI